MASDPKTCAHPGCPEEEWRIGGYCSVYCRDLHTVELDVREEMAGELAHALAQAAAWEAKAEGLEGALKAVQEGLDDCWVTLPEGQRAVSLLRSALSAPRPEPGRLLEVVRAGMRWKLWYDRYRETSTRGDRIRETEARDQLWWLLERLTPEERQALGEDTP